MPSRRGLPATTIMAAYRQLGRPAAAVTGASTINYAQGQARVLGISRVEPRSRGGVTVRGVATSGMNAGYAGYGGQQPV